ncbi:MAG: SDR family NAD(P)-dependent oxidoreductase [Sandaracinaceae bacterium]|nr:SDR family NAD(P)-dependent oxidoreductase [Sandaracinaceae bacterium]
MLITGVGSGLGRESARVLALRGARVLGAARTLESAEEACRTFGPEAVPLACDLGEPGSVRACVERVRELGPPIDVLMCNAGIMALPQRTLLHGHEAQLFTNHVGHFMLVTGLLDRLSERARVVVLSSSAHGRAPREGIRFDDLSFERGYDAWTAYGQSKLANLLFARALARRFEGTTKTANAVHPGVIATKLTRHMSLSVRVVLPLASAVALKDVHQGAATQCFVAAHPSLEGVSGEYFADCNVARSSRSSRDAEMGERLWEVTERIVAAL